MARPFKLYEKLLAETQQTTNTGNTRSRKQKQVATRGQREIETSNDRQYNFNFPNELMTRRKLAEKTGVPPATIDDFIERGLLKAIRFPKYHYDKFSPCHLERLIKNFNHLFIFWFFIVGRYMLCL